MHKLLVRQLRHHMGITENAEIPQQWQQFLDAVSAAYDAADQDLIMIERSLSISSAELVSRNETLSKTLDELKSLQSQLVHTAKMAGLRELVAGISHEINTPAGAISNAIEEIKRIYPELLVSFMQLVKSLSSDLLAQYFNACNFVLKVQHELGTSEIRNVAKTIDSALSAAGLPQNSSMSKNLASIGFDAQSALSIIDLLKSQDAEIMYRALFKLGMSQRHIRNIQVAISRVIHLVKALKLYNHSEQDTITLSNLADDIRNTLVILENKIKRGITVVEEFEAISPIHCYADQLNQVWTNIINNAIEAMQYNGRIIIRIKKINNYKIAVEIEDNGPGVAANIVDKLFQPYVTTKPKGEGTGLGLSISKDIVLKHKGTINFESKPGKTVFIVILPIDLNSIYV